MVAASVWRRVRHAFRGEAIGPLELKGRAQPVEAFRILGDLQSPSTHSTPFVGRHDELSLMELLWSSAAKGTTHVISLVGEPGIGKSRLVAEFPVRREALDLRITCRGDRAFGPFLDLIESVLGRMPSDLVDLRELTAPLEGVDEEVTLLLAALFGLADAPPTVAMADDHQKSQVFLGVLRFLIAAPAGRPALFVFDDLHWADRSSIDLLEFLLERLIDLPFLIVLSRRPGSDPVAPASHRASHTGIRLELLPPEESVALARGFLGVTEIPPELEEVITSRAGGNPFFVEELLRALTEMGSLSVQDGRVLLGDTDADVPETVQGTILARVDRLDSAEQSLLQCAAVVGRTFGADVLTRVLASGDLMAPLEELTRAQLIVADGPGRWAFKHALVQEVVYETILIRRRVELHRKVAQAIEGLGGEDPGKLELLAEHYARADVREKAREYALAAGDAAIERMGFVEAKTRFATALRLWGEGDDEGRLTLLMKLGWAALLSGDSSEARTVLLEAEAGWRAIGRMRDAGAALATIGRTHFFTGDIVRAAQALDQAVEILETEGPSRELVQAIVWRSILGIVGGGGQENAAMVAKGLRMAEEMRLDVARSHLLTSLGSFEVISGDPAGVDRIRAAVRLAGKCGEAEAIGRAYLNLALGLAAFSLNREGISITRQGRDTARKLGAPSFEWSIAAIEVGMLEEIGRYEDAERLARTILGPRRTVTVVPSLVLASHGLVRALIRRGRYEEARTALDEALPPAHLVGGSLVLGPALTLEAELEEARGNRASAVRALAEAIAGTTHTSSVAHWFGPLWAAATLLPREDARTLLDHVREGARQPAFRARLLEAEGLVEEDRAMITEAADLYASLELPYEVARCLMVAGDLKGAAEIVRRLGVEAGPLGTRLGRLMAQHR